MTSVICFMSKRGKCKIGLGKALNTCIFIWILA